MVLYDSNEFETNESKIWNKDEAEQQDIKITYIVHPQIILDNLILGPYKEPSSLDDHQITFCLLKFS